MSTYETPVVVSVVVFRDAAGEYRWQGKAGNGGIVAVSGEGYVNHGDAKGAAASLFPEATLIDQQQQEPPAQPA